MAKKHQRKIMSDSERHDIIVRSIEDTRARIVVDPELPEYQDGDPPGTYKVSVDNPLWQKIMDWTLDTARTRCTVCKAPHKGWELEPGSGRCDDCRT